MILLALIDGLLKRLVKFIEKEIDNPRYSFGFWIIVFVLVVILACTEIVIASRELVIKIKELIQMF